MHLIDTDVISEARKGSRADAGVRHFFSLASAADSPVFISVITIGELRRGVELVRHRKDMKQAKLLEAWLDKLLADYSDHLLEFGSEEAHVWGRLRVPKPENAIDKQIAATALTHGLIMVTRNTDHFTGFGLELLNPFMPK
jgi:predicted nucleic acid-binding protein